MGRSSVGFNHRARVLVVGIAVASVVAVGTATAAGAGRPTLSASRHVAGLPAVTWPRSITLSGHETLGGTRSFRVQAQAFPFTKGFRTIASGKTTGSYSIAVKPSHATRYRVVIGGKTSPVLTVYVIERTVSSSCNLCHPGNTAGAHTLLVTSKIQAPPGPLAAHSPEYLYYGQNNGSNTMPSTLHLVKTAPLEIHGQILSSSVRYTVHFPPTAFEFAYASCFRDAESADGLNLPGHHHCGDATVQRGEYLG